MTELLDTARAIVDRSTGSEQVEAFLTHDRDFQVKAFMGEAETVAAAEPRGAGVRVLTEGRVGFAYTTDLTEAGLTDVVERARTNARFATEDEALALAERSDPKPLEGLFDAGQSQVPAERKVAFAVELEEATRSFDPRIRTVEEAGYADSDSEIAIATSSGLAGHYRRTDAWCYAVAIAADGDDTQVGFEFALAKGLDALDPHDVAARSAQRALRILGAKKIPSTRMPVVLEPYTAGRLGDVVAPQAFSLVDDGRAYGAPGAAPWDAEGTPTQRTEVISGGVLRSFLYDIPSARREGRASTGNAARAGFKSPPGPSPSNLAFDATGETQEEVLRRAGRALMVQDFHGVHSGANPVSGDFSVGATGYLVEDGGRGQPVKEVTIAAPMLEILRRTVAIADDRRWLPFGGSYGGATTLIEEMTVGGS